MTRIQLRRDTSSNWQTNNPTPSLGEPCYEIDTKKLKIGDGVTKYNDLQYFAGGGVTDAYTKAETDNLLDTKQDKLIIGPGLSLTNNEISIDTQSYKGLVYSNNDTSFGTLDYSTGIYNQNTVIKYPTIKDGLSVVAFDSKINNITSFDYMTVVKVTDLSNPNGVVMFAGNAAANYVSIDCWGSNYLRAVCTVNGSTTTQESIINPYNTFVALRLQHTGTTLNVYTYISPNGELPSNDEDWALKYTREWDLSQNPIAGEGLYLFILGGSIFRDSSIKTTNTIGGSYLLKQTVLTVNNTNIFNKLSNANSVIASKDELGLVKIDDNTIVLNNNSQLEVSDTITKQGNTFNGASQLVQLDSSGKLPAIDGSQLTGISAGNPSYAYSVTTLNSNQDLNSLTTEGLYFVDGGSNFPSGVSSTRGFIRVEKLNYPDWGAINGSLVQTFTTINSLSPSTPPEVYTRQRTSTTFSPWTKVNTPSPSIATTTTTGIVKPDGTTITVTQDGTISANISTSTGALKYWTGTEANYTAIETKDADTLYRTTDTNKVFLGTIQLGGNT